MALYVLGYWMGIHFYGMVPQFQLYVLYLVKFGINIFTRCGLCQDTISTYKLFIYVKNMQTNFHEIQGPVIYFSNLMKTHDPNSY